MAYDKRKNKPVHMKLKCSCWPDNTRLSRLGKYKVYVLGYMVNGDFVINRLKMVCVRCKQEQAFAVKPEKMIDIIKQAYDRRLVLEEQKWTCK
jgi:hypothetical protein